MIKIKLFKGKQRDAPKRHSTLSIFLEGSGDDFPVGYTRLSANPDVQMCLYKIADAVSNMTVMLMQNGADGDMRIKNELSKKIDVDPCGFMTRKNFIFRICMDMLNYGNAFAIPITEQGYISDIIPVVANQFVMRPHGGSYEISYKGQTFSPDEVLHFVHYPDEFYPWRGRGVAPMIKDVVANLAQQNATKKGFLKSKWKPPLIISIDADAEELQDPELRKTILGSYVETTEAGEPWVIPTGEIDVKTIRPLTLQDLAVQDGIKLDRQVLAAAIGVPGFMVGAGTFNQDEYNNFIGTTVYSAATIIQQELSKKILYSPDMYFKLNPKSLMQYSLSEKMSFVKDMVAGGMLSRNEGRTEFDYSPADKDGMNDYNVLENYIPVDRLGDQKKLKGEDDE